jgi:hypothetical protein
MLPKHPAMHAAQTTFPPAGCASMMRRSIAKQNLKPPIVAWAKHVNTAGRMLEAKWLRKRAVRRALLPSQETRKPKFTRKS